MFMLLCGTAVGVAPTDAREFIQWLNVASSSSSSSSSLSHLKYSVLALGDSSYVHFCRSGRTLDSLWVEFDVFFFFSDVTSCMLFLRYTGICHSRRRLRGVMLTFSDSRKPSKFLRVTVQPMTSSHWHFAVGEGRNFVKPWQSFALSWMLSDCCCCCKQLFPKALQC